ncbi:MAG TPA: response regulator [Polyangiaceae bacterium]|nr:response regulator [Polyangiaceae bacterium]
MPKGRVLIIESDEWASTLLAKFLREAGYEVEVEEQARSGFDRVRALEPDCIVCGVALPDIDGFWVARRVRAEQGPVGATPFLFLIDEQDLAGRLHGLNVGGDLFLTKPFRNEVAVAQVGALIGMAKRLKATLPPATEGPPSSGGSTVLQGDLAEMSVSTVLTLLELERRTGRLRARSSDGRTALFDLVDGTLARAELDDATADPLLAMRALLGFTAGTFLFRARPVESTAAPQNLSALMLEALRIEDESKRSHDA